MLTLFTRSVPSLSRKIVFLTASALMLVIIAGAGCGGDGLGKRYYVSGTVSYKGQPLEKGQITFAPEGDIGKADVRSASGLIEKGKYVLTTNTDGDGAFPGKYKVTIVSKNADMSKAADNVKKTGGSQRQDDVAKAYAQAKDAVPPKYSLPTTSGLTATVEAKTNTIDFDLKD